MKTIMMRDQRVHVEEAPRPEPGPGQVLVRSLACGICGSDLHIVRHAKDIFDFYQEIGVMPADADTGDLAISLGHEFCAEVVAYGPETAQRIPPGGRVTAVPMLLTEQGSRKRASLHVVAGREALRAHDPGGLEVLDCAVADFRAALLRGNHTLKRALTNPRRLSGIGGAYSDEIMWEARVSPLKLNSRLTDDEIERLWRATREVMARWIERFRERVGEGFPEKVTAFQEEMAVHGKYKQPCPDCGAPVQRIVYASNETNYCAGCQTGGKLLADRALSQLMKKDWPKTLEGWEELRNK